MELLSIILETTDPKAQIDSFFDKYTLGTLAGASMAVYIICGVTQKVFNYNPKWLGLLLSVLFSFFAAYLAKTPDPILVKAVMALVNACLIYASATGTNTIIAAPTPAPEPGGDGPAPSDSLHESVAPYQRKRKFSTRWF